MEKNQVTFTFPNDPDEICDTLYSTQTYFSRCVGFCTFHNGYVTIQQLKTKKCMTKNCNALIKQEKHRYWKELEQKKLKKELKKAELKRKKEIAESKKHIVMTNNIVTNKKTNPVQKQKRYICITLEMCKLTSKERKKAKGLACEVIQIGAVMLDENLNYLKEFSSFVKPVYGQLTEEISQLTKISNETLQHADTFTTVFYKLFSWAGNEDITTFCWSDAAYKQLWDEIYIKAKEHDEYRTFLRTFVDLQMIFKHNLKADKSVSMDVALKFCHLKVKGERHSAIFDAFNTARIFYKMHRTSLLEDTWNYIVSYTETEMAKKYFKVNSLDNDYTSSFASFISPELLEKIEYKKKNEKKDKSEKEIKEVRRIAKLITPFFSCSQYGICFSDWIIFSFRMKFTKDLKIPKIKDD